MADTPLTAGIELEAKFDAGPEVVLPDLDGVVPGLVVGPGAERELDAVYHDTDDLRLVRRGVTLRRRTSGDEAVWTVKFPVGGDGADLLRRREIDLIDAGTEPPEVLRSLVRAYTRSAALSPVARLVTRRRSASLTREGAPAATIDDDEVSVLADGGLLARFREIEVEAAPGAGDDVLPAVGRRMADAGCVPADPTPKLVRALGPRALEPVPPVPVRLGPDPTAGEVLRSAMSRSVGRVLDHHHVIRLDDDIEGVHQARVGTRRLRSDLRTFRAVVDRTWSEPLRDELRWLGAELGRVRDADVLLLALRAAVDELPDDADRAAGAQLLESLVAERALEQARLVEVLDSPRYVALLDRLVDAAEHPRLTGDAARPAADVLPRLVRKPWRRLRRDALGLAADAPDAAFHRVRIDLKRVRYAADVAVPVVGEPARNLARALAAAQDLLGEHQDAAVAEQWLRRAVADAPADQALVAGQLIATRRLQARSLRDAWPAAWQAIDVKANRRWLR